MIGIPIGLVAANAGEWFIHKYLLHGLGRNKKSFWSFHWHEHHREARKNGMYDPQYKRSLWSWQAQTKEAVPLAAGAVAVSPLFPLFPFFTGTIWYRMYAYYRIHKKAHLDPQWAKEHLPWHYDHHLGKNQDSNWCVTHPFFDHVMGTREHFLKKPLHVV